MDDFNHAVNSLIDKNMYRKYEKICQDIEKRKYMKFCN